MTSRGTTENPSRRGNIPWPRRVRQVSGGRRRLSPVPSVGEGGAQPRSGRHRAEGARAEGPGAARDGRRGGAEVPHRPGTGVLPRRADDEVGAPVAVGVTEV